MTVEKLMENIQARLAAAAVPEEKLRSVAEELAVFFGVHSHEIGLFTVDTRNHSINFRWPLSMAQVGHIPLKAVNSLVAKTANEKLSTLDNNFARSRHLFMFEHMLAEKSERIPVQKIMSVPVTTGDAAAGVIQVTRKAPAVEEAGTDFSSNNLADLEKIAASLGSLAVL